MSSAREQCWVLIGIYLPLEHQWQVQRQRRVRGSRESVTADWAWALDREETRGDVLGFLHTHPAGAGTRPSERDTQSMRAWCSALGKPLLCIIRERREIAGYVFLNAEKDGQPVRSILSTGPGGFLVEE